MLVNLVTQSIIFGTDLKLSAPTAKNKYDLRNDDPQRFAADKLPHAAFIRPDHKMNHNFSTDGMRNGLLTSLHWSNITE